ncbi:efflux RND transporter periplasmic adaptor subunit [Seohaeicola saemankumensis]|nr:efflux RND transporter periplasmic adaptor subunit [Seohaeicola saemankumensis]MCA0869887.1 efflux RND transporter periplasmic adaptor subunit [Seohaeicola saemankumensis]
MSLVVLFHGEAFAQQVETTVRPVKVQEIVASNFLLERTYPAIAYPSQEVELSFRMSGRVIELPIRASASIAEGDVVAKLDSRDFEAEVTQLEARIEEAEANLLVLRSGARPEEIAALEANVEAAAARRDQSKDEYERTLQLVEREVVSAAQLEQSLAAYRVAEADLRSQRNQLAIGQIGGRPEEIIAAEASIRGLKAQLQAAKDRVSDATLRAPFSGVVARRDIKNFSNIQAGESVALIQNLRTLEVGFDVPGTDIVAMAATGFEMLTNEVVFDALPDLRLDGELVEFATQADAATQTYRGRLLVELPDQAVVLPGMVARVFVSSKVNDSQIFVLPQTALAASPGGDAYVWKLDKANNTVHRHPVQIGDATAEGVVVSSGVMAGEIVVTAGLGDLQEGMQVRPIQKVGE